MWVQKGQLARAGAVSIHVLGLVMLTTSNLQARATQDQQRDLGGRLQEVVVTAQKRSENVQKVPVTVDVLSSAQIQQQGITSAPELVKSVPGLIFQYLNGQADPYIRGMGSEQTNLTQESSVGVYVDGVYQAGTTSSLTQFADVDRIEVLKGPQGTLFGRNTTGGAINIITRDPQPGFQGSVDASGGTWGTTRFRSYVTGGSETVSASLATVYAYHSGYVHNLYDNTWLNNLNTAAVRGKLLAHFSENWSATLAVGYSENHDTSNLAYVYYNDNAQPLNLGGRISTSPHATYNDQGSQERRIVQDYGTSITVKGRFADATFVSISAFGRDKDKSAEDTDASDINEGVLWADQMLRSFSQEFQLISPNSDRLRWIGGLYYFTSDGGFPKPTDLVISQGDDPAATIYLAGQQKTMSVA